MSDNSTLAGGGGAGVGMRERRELLCMVCDRDYPGWFAPNDLWNRVMRRPDGTDEYPFICPTCFALAAVERGESGSFELSVQDLAVSPYTIIDRMREHFEEAVEATRADLRDPAGPLNGRADERA